MNRRLVLAITCVIGLSLCAMNAGAVPQHGTAKDGYYPPGYAGDTFTGVVTAADDASRSITLTYTNPKNDKPETLTASFKTDFKARMSDGTVHPVKPSDFPLGTNLKIYYMTAEHKVEGKKVKTLSILSFRAVPASR